MELPSTQLYVSNAFNFPGFGLQQEDFPLFSDVVETLVMRLLQQYADGQDEHNRYVVSLNVDILLYRQFGRVSKNLTHLKTASLAFMDDLFLRDKTPAFTEAVIAAMKTLFSMKVFTRTTILPKLEYLLEGEADCSDAVTYLMGIGLTADAADRLFVRSNSRVAIFMTLILVVLHLFVQRIPPLIDDIDPTRRITLVPTPAAVSQVSGMSGQYVTLDQFSELKAQIEELLQLQRSVPALARSAAPPVQRNTTQQTFTLEDSDDDVPLQDTIRASRLDQQSHLLQRGIAAINAGSHLSLTATIPTTVPAQEALAMLRATYDVGRADLLGGDLYLRIYGPTGLFLVNLFHIVHLFKRTEAKQHSGINSKIIAMLYNPDASTSYETAAMTMRSPDMFPTSIEQWKTWHMKEYNRTHQIVVDYECLPGMTVPATVGLYMSQYYEKMMNLFQVVLGGTDETTIQRNSRHVTLWWLLMVFHYNTWTRAVIMKQLGLLVLNFEMRFSMLYQSKVTDSSWCTLKDALLNLSYCCSRCNRIGSSLILCTTTDCQSIQPKSGRSSQSDSKGYYSALKLWKKNNKSIIVPFKDLPASEKNAKEITAFKASNAFKELPVATPTSSVPLREVEDYMTMQHLIPIPMVMKST